MRELFGARDPAPDAVPDGELDAARLAALYPWPDDRPWLRLAMLRCVDGGVAGADGRSRSVSSAADRAVLGEIRRLADAVVTGAGTMRAEPYGPIRVTDDGGRTSSERARLGLGVAPRLVVVSGRLDLPWDAPVFAESALPVLVLTGPDAPDQAARAASRRADVVRLEAVTPASLLAALHERGLRRLVCEGGPGLAAQVAASGLLDEVDLTLSPTLAPSGPHVAAVPGAAPGQDRRLELVHALSDDGFLFLRYLRRP